DAAVGLPGRDPHPGNYQHHRVQQVAAAHHVADNFHHARVDVLVGVVLLLLHHFLGNGTEHDEDTRTTEPQRAEDVVKDADRGDGRVARRGSSSATASARFVILVVILPRVLASRFVVVVLVVEGARAAAGGPVVRFVIVAGSGSLRRRRGDFGFL